MSRRIQEDHKEFRDVIGGKVDEQIKKYIKNGKMIGWRPKGGKFLINIPEIDLPTFRYGKNKFGWGRGPGKPGDVIRDPKEKGKGSQPGDTPGDTIPVGIDLQYILDVLREQLELPDLQPKDCSQVFREKIIYNGIKKTGPESLRHTRRTMKNTMIRMMQSDEYNYEDPVLIPIQEDKRFRSWNVRHIPESNAAIFFARDWSGSMDATKCEIVMNTAWWIDCWIRQFYKRTETVYIGHDTEAQEVDRDKFYSARYGGGTHISSAFQLIKEKIDFTYPANAWNIYIFYFSDGENFDYDNKKVVELIRELDPKYNLLGIGQILNSPYGEPFLQYIEDNAVKSSKIRTYDYKINDKDDKNKEFEMIKSFLGKESMKKDESSKNEENSINKI